MDRESAYEIPQARAQKQAADTSAQPVNTGGRQREGVAEALAKSAMRAIGSQLGRQLVRGIMGSLLGGRR